MELLNVIDNVYWLKQGRRTLVSLNMVRDRQVYGEKLFDIKSQQYREWIPDRSKLAAAFYKGFRNVDIKKGYKILYLGASSGTTVSHVSDIVGADGSVYAVELSEEMGIKLILLAESRKNIFPIIGDARKVKELVGDARNFDFIYQDISQRDQIDIFIGAVQSLLKPGKSAAIAIKTKSIDVRASSRDVIDQEVKKLGKFFKVTASINLYPYQKDHALVFVTKRQ